MKTNNEMPEPKPTYETDFLHCNRKKQNSQQLKNIIGCNNRYISGNLQGFTTEKPFSVGDFNNRKSENRFLFRFLHFAKYNSLNKM